VNYLKLPRRRMLLMVAYLSLLVKSFCLIAAAENDIEIENQRLKLIIGSDAVNKHFIDKNSMEDYCLLQPVTCFAHLKKNSTRYNASEINYLDGEMKIFFADTDTEVILKVETKTDYITFEVLYMNDESNDELTFFDIELTSKGTLEDTFASCALAMNVHTRVVELPGPSSRLKAICYKKFGIIGAKVAIIGCLAEDLRFIMQQVVSVADGLPKSGLGGPWALDADRELTRGSYIFNFSGITLSTADKWIEYTKSMGANQINFHGGIDSKLFRFGDCRPHPETYPNAFRDFKAVIARLHDSGIKAGLHTYAFFIDKSCPWVSPIPDDGLAYDSLFVLSEGLTNEAQIVVVQESLQDIVDPKTGYFVRNSVTLRIGDELITYSGLTKKEPYSFIGCRRGAYGTQVSEHPKGSRVYHLKECFGHFVPDPNSELWDKVVARTADAYNVCDFDMIYLDAIDAADIFAGKNDSWYYQAKFVFDLCKRLKKPACMEMSSFSHHLWFVRSRMGAWDVSKHSHKKFIDIHQSQNEKYEKLFLPSNIGWWTLTPWDGVQSEFRFPEDIEYLLCRSLGSDSSLSFINGTPEQLEKDEYFQKVFKIARAYEELRNDGYFNESIRQEIKTPGREYRLEKTSDADWEFREVAFLKHKISCLDGVCNRWTVNNQFEPQPLKVRIEALYSVGSYDCQESLTLADFEEIGDMTKPYSSNHIEAVLEPNYEIVKYSAASLCFKAVNKSCSRDNSWTQTKRVFPDLMDLTNNQALGVWIYGDGKGEILNFQYVTPEHLVPVIADHYVVVDFNGWKYFELVEFEGERFEDYNWPYADVVYDLYRQSYAIYSWHMNFKGVESLGIWYNNIPAQDSVECYISPVKALPLVTGKVINPSIIVNGKKITFDCEFVTGQYLEFMGTGDCRIYDSKGHFVKNVEARGDVVNLNNNLNEIYFECEKESDLNIRTRVTIMTQSQKPLTAKD
jgi:hypothetical protein